MLYASDSKAAKTDDAGAQKRGSVQIGESLGKRKYEIRTGGGILSRAAVAGIAAAGGRSAKDLKPVLVITALPVIAADPGNTNTGPNRKLRVGPLHDFAHNLMTRN